MRTHRRRAETPRERYLSVAERMAGQRCIDDGPGAPMVGDLAGHILLADVAIALGKSRTALYKLWDTQHDFSVDLSRYMVIQHDYARSNVMLPWHSHRDTPPRPGSPFDRLRATSNELQHALFEDVMILVRGASIGAAADPRLDALRESAELHRLNDLSLFVSGSLRQVSRRVDRRLHPADLAVGLWCLSDGIRILGHDRPELSAERLWLSSDGESALPWGIFGYVVRAMVLHLTSAESSPGRDATAAPNEAHPEVTDVDGTDVDGTDVDGTDVDGTDVEPPYVSPEQLWSPRQLEALDAGVRAFVDLLSGSAANAEARDSEPTTLSHITIARVARASGVSRRAVYDVWPTRSQLLVDLLASVLLRSRANFLGAFDRSAADRSAVDPTGGGTGTMLAAIVDAIAVDLDREVDHGSADFHILHAFITESDPTFRSLIQNESRLLVDGLAARIVRLIEIEGHNLADGVTPTHLAVIVIAAVDGIRRLRRTCPSALRLGTAERTTGHTAPAIFVSAVFEQSLVPVERRVYPSSNATR